MDPQTGNQYKYKNHKRPTDNQTNICTDGRTEGQTEGQADILYCHAGDLNPWPASACAARNYGPHDLIAKSDVNYQI